MWELRLKRQASHSPLTMHIGFTYDLRSDYLALGYSEEETAEFDQIGTIDAINCALQELGHTTDRIGHARNLVERLAQDDRWDLVFNICEGLFGRARESQVPAILDVYEIPYTFSDAAVLVTCLDKAITKMIVRAAGIPTPDWYLVTQLTDVDGCPLPFPVIAKPVAEGTGKGIDAASKIVDRRTLRDVTARLLEQFDEPVLVERFLPGREFTVGLLGSGTAAAAIGTIEILLRSNAEHDVYSYINKEQSEVRCDLPLVSALDDPQVAEAERVALAAWRAVGGRDAGRIDLRCDEHGNPQLMEINPLAGLHPTHSDLPIIWTSLGRDYMDLIDCVVKSASARTSKNAARNLIDNQPPAVRNSKS